MYHMYHAYHVKLVIAAWASLGQCAAAYKWTLVHDTASIILIILSPTSPRSWGYGVWGDGGRRGRWGAMGWRVVGSFLV